MIEILGENSSKRTDVLADGLRVALGSDARVSRPTRLATFRVRGLDPSVECDEVRAAVAALSSLGSCPISDVSMSEIRRLPGGLRVAWVRCPVNSAGLVVSRGRMIVG